MRKFSHVVSGIVAMLTWYNLSVGTADDATRFLNMLQQDCGRCAATAKVSQGIDDDNEWSWIIMYQADTPYASRIDPRWNSDIPWESFR